MKVRLVLLLALLALPLAVLRADSQTDAWISKARASLGSERALNAVNSIHFTGLLDTMQEKKDKDGKISLEPVHLTIDIIFQRPYQQRVTLRSEKIIDVVGLDDYDGWHRRASVSNEANSELSLMDPVQIKHLRATAWENLFFYKGIEQRGGQVEYQGEETVDGKPCVKLDFVHSDDIVYKRYFERATGKLIKTITDNGGEIREEGEIIDGGVKFPQKLIIKDKSGENTTITFSSIKVNESFAPAIFAVPPIGR